jgi:hypothetical protein
MKIAPNGIRKAFRRGVRYARRDDAYARGVRDGLERAMAEVKPIIMQALEKAVGAAYARGIEAGRAEAREHMEEMCKKAYAAGCAQVANALTPEALKAAGERALELAEIENEARDAQKH